MKYKKAIVWILTVVLSLVYLFVGNKIASKDMTVFNDPETVALKAKVVTVDSTMVEKDTTGTSNSGQNVTTVFTCKILEGKLKGKTVKALQSQDPSAPASDRTVSAGDKIVLYNYQADEGNIEWSFGGYVRFDALLIFAIFFFILLIIFGRGHGINTIISLIFTCIAVFLVYIPSILSGFNIYISTLVTCVFITVMTLLITNGWSRKTLTTILGCIFGVLVAACLSWILNSVLKLTGYVDEHSMYLSFISTKHPINLVGIVFGGIVVGSLGAVMDVAMDVSSALSELRRHSENITFNKLVKSGLTIGRDIMGTMSNTLVLAYIGSSLSTVLLLTVYASTATELLNREMIIVELLQALIGSTAILLTIPLTSLICGFMYVTLDKKKNKDSQITQQ